MLEVVGELVGLVIELKVGEVLVVKDHGDGIGRLSDLRFKVLGE